MLKVADIDRHLSFPENKICEIVTCSARRSRDLGVRGLRSA